MDPTCISSAFGGDTWKKEESLWHLHVWTCLEMPGGGNGVGFLLDYPRRFGEGKTGAESPYLYGKGRV